MTPACGQEGTTFTIEPVLTEGPCKPCAKIQTYSVDWVAVVDFTLSYPNPETTLFTAYPFCGSLS